MGFLYEATKVVGNYGGGNSCGDNDDLTVREKVIEFAQEKVAEREMEKCQPGYVEKHKSIVEKAVEAAEGYIAKQGRPYRDDDEDSCSSSSSSSDSSSECETKEYSSYTKTSRDIPGTNTRVEEEVTVSVRTTTAPEYPSVATQNYNSSSYREADSYGAFSNNVSSSSEYSSTQVRNETEYETKEYSSYSRTSRDDSDEYRPGNYGGASRVDEEVSYSSRTTATPEYPSYANRDYNSSSYPQQDTSYGATNRMPLESNSVSTTSEYRSTRTIDEDECERKEYSSYSRTTQDDSGGFGRNNFGAATPAYSTRVEEDVDYSTRATSRPDYAGDSSREYNRSSYQRTIRQDDNCDALNRMTLESNDIEYRSARVRDEADYERKEYSTYSRTSRDDSDYSTRVSEEVDVSVRTTSAPGYPHNSTQNCSSSSYQSVSREDNSYGAFNDVSSSSEYRSTRVRDGAGYEREESSSYSRTKHDDSSEYRPGTFGGVPSYSSRVDEEVSYSSSRTTERTGPNYPSDEFKYSSRPAYGTREAKEAVEKYAGSGDSIKNVTADDKKRSDLIFSKAMEAAEKYHAEEKVVEFAQKRVAKREEGKLKPGYEEKNNKSVVDKAVETADDFLAKQGDKCGGQAG
ncbi:Myosin-I heavy chain [Phytophthora cinnamomi]|uniref:Myosin-I heavy chain n=1 Tax=Phytophthora cinnamomi TaxID=4785 RepID=UPI00355AB869|nr:Myosin-I heavy chain [Phytophthora cinnamomi]